MGDGRATITIERRWALGVAVATFAVIAGLIVALIVLAADDEDGWEHPAIGPGMMAPGYGYGPGEMPHGGYGMDPGEMPHGGYGMGPGAGYGPYDGQGQDGPGPSD